MADKEVGGLTAATTLDGSELLHVVQGSNSRKTTVSAILGTAHSQAWSGVTGTPTTVSGYGITDAQAKNANLTAIAALSPTSKSVIIGNGSAWTAESGATFRTSVGLAIGADVQAYDADLTALGGLAKADGNVIIGDGTTWTVESGATLRTSFGLSIGTDVQAYNATLASLAGLTLTDGDLLYSTGASALANLARGADGQVLRLSGGMPSWASVTGTGDMAAAIYDPNSVGGDAFSQDNMVDGTTNKNFTAAEKTKLAGAGDMLAANDLSEVDPNAALKNLGAGMVKDSIAALRSFTAASSAVMANVIGYVTDSLTGGGDFWHDASDTTSTDDGGTVIVDSIGRRWKRRFTSTRPEQWGAVGYREDQVSFKARLAAGTATDDYAALQAALNYLGARGGGTLKLSRFYKSNTPLIVPYGVSIKGIGRNASGIYKDSTTTVTVTYYDSAATPQVTIYPGSLPTAANAVLILGTSYANGRWVGNLRGFSYGSTLATASDYESQKAEFGILSVGSISDFIIDDLGPENCQYGMLIPTPFAGRISNNRVHRCLHGYGIGNSTSTTYYSNYASECRSYGHAFRAGIYGSIFDNACDLLNDPTLYPDRTLECSAYILDSILGVKVFANGQEQTYGNGWVLDTLRYCEVKNNLCVQIGSDYSGSADIAVWKVKTAIVGCEVTGNTAFEVKASGLISGSANSAKHHNLFQEAGTLWAGTTFHNNVVRATKNGLDGEAGWLNNNIVECLTVKRGGIYTRAEADSTYGNILQGAGSTSSTYALDVRNGSGTSLMRLRGDGAAFLPTVLAQTTGAAANVFIGTGGALFTSTSALKYKDVIGPIPDDMIDKVMAMVGFIYSQKGDDTKRRFVGLAADDFHAAGLTEFVHYGADGEPEGLMYERIVAVIMEAHRKLEARVSAIEARLA